MTWRDRMRAASFRGVAFHVESDERQAGRRVQVHEYPLRDEPYTEDLGRVARHFGVTGYLIGENYLSGLNRLLSALEAAGPGTLVHPFFGSHRVMVDGMGTRVTHSNREGGMARVDMLFVEAGSISLPGILGDTVSKLLGAADRLRSAVDQAFGLVFTVTSLPAWVASEAARYLDLIGIGADYGISWSSPTSVTRTSVPVAVREWAGSQSWTQALTALGSLPTPPASAATSTRAQVRTNARAIEQLTACTLIERLGEIAASSGLTTGSEAPAAEWQAYEDAVVYRDAAAEQIEDRQLAVADAPELDPPEAIYAALADVRTALVAHINAAATEYAHLETFTPAQDTPALVIAWRLYADAERDAEIIARNMIAHPGFCSGTLQVLDA